DPGDVVQGALALHRAGKTVEARTLLEERIAEMPDDTGAHLAYIDLRIGLGERERVRKEYEELGLKDPSNPAVRLARVVLLGRSYSKQEAFRALLAEEPGFARAWEEYGRFLLESYRIGEAEEAIGRAIALSPERPEGHLYLGLVRRARGAPDEEASLRRAFELDPETPNLRLELATTLAFGGKLEEAELILEELRLESPDDPEPILILAIVNERLGRAAESKRLRELLLAKDPDLPGKLLYVGLQHAALTDKTLSKRFLELAVFVDSTEAEPFVQLGLVYRWEKKSDLAIHYYTMALERNAENQLAWRNMGMAYREKGNVAKAEELLRKAVEIDPDYLLGWVDFARILQEVGKYDEAIPAWKRVLAMAPYGWEGLEARRCLPYLERGEPVPEVQTPAWTMEEMKVKTKAKREAGHQGAGENR
ncbi:MAG: tetratricopeptide repeat protein, partial [Candidatus Latescibacterota bacterium]